METLESEDFGEFLDAAVAALKEQGLVANLRDERLAHLSLLDNLTFPLLGNILRLLESQSDATALRDGLGDFGAELARLMDGEYDGLFLYHAYRATDEPTLRALLRLAGTVVAHVDLQLSSSGKSWDDERATNAVLAAVARSAAYGITGSGRLQALLDAPTPIGLVEALIATLEELES